MHRTLLSPSRPLFDGGCGGFQSDGGRAAIPARRAIPAAPARSPRTPASPEQRKAASEQEAAAIAAAMQQVVRAKTDYRISPADLISVTVYQDPNEPQGARQRQRHDLLPLIGAVKVGGMTLIEAQAAIEAKLAQFLVSPQVSLFIEDYGNKTIFVMGEVQKPGSYPIPTESRMTVLEAISTAGGFTAVAAQERARVCATSTASERDLYDRHEGDHAAGPEGEGHGSRAQRHHLRPAELLLGPWPRTSRKWTSTCRQYLEILARRRWIVFSISVLVFAPRRSTRSSRRRSSAPRPC